MLFKSIVQAACVATAIAQPLQQQQHQHHQHEKKDVHTEIVYVTVGANDVKAAAAPAVATSASVVTEAVSTGSASSVAASAASSAAAPQSSGNFAGAAKGITYSPYADDGTCKPASQVKSEVEKLSDYEIIRLYGVDCDQVPNVLAGFSSGQKLFAGIFDVSAISAGVSTLASAVEAAGGWDIVHTVSIGNELVNAGSANPSQIKSYVEEGKSALQAAGYTGPVVSVDTFIAVINNPDLCNYSDYMAVNAHAFFDGNVDANGAGEWLLEQIQRVSSACNGAKVLITETGWPTRGDTNNKAVPGSTEQQAALSAISSSCGNDALYFNAYNDMWKADGSFNAEKYWGIYSS